MAVPNASLIICTCNRGEQLRRCLAAIPAEAFLSTGTELIIVDNGSTDSTGELLERHRAASRYAVTIIHEPERGLSRARNAGLAAASGWIIAFTDDDCYLAPGYPRALIEAFAAGRFDYCGGRILLHDETDAKYTVNYQEQAELIAPGTVLLPGRVQGANMAFTRRAVEIIGPFDPCLGAGTRFRIEDIDYVARASLAGLAGAHVPEIVVYHHHGRKPGPEIEAHKRADAFARGAYWTKYLLQGHWDYLRAWAGTARRRRDLGVVMSELRGACAYAWFRLWNRRSASDRRFNRS